MALKKGLLLWLLTAVLLLSGCGQDVPQETLPPETQPAEE